MWLNLSANSLSGKSVVDFLRTPESYGKFENAVECVETHISWVFLTDRFAFKLKKPIRFDFLDFSTLELRENACREELRLNRRLAPHVYLDVLPITVSGDRLKFGPPGQVIDWVVKMRRLPADRAVDRLIKADALLRSDVERIARTLSDFYLQLPPVLLKTKDYLEEIAQHVRDNEQELLQPRHGLDPDLVERVHEAQRLLLALAPDVLESRVLDGRIVEGHGDLRPEHIYLPSQPVIIDCIEFNHKYRILDVADELSFLAMECAKLNAPWIGQRIWAAYRTCCGDNPPSRLIAFYKSYRASVRAKVSALRADQLGGSRREEAREDARRYLDLANEFAGEIGPRLLVVVGGRSGTGKSTLAGAIAQRLGVTCLHTDVIRRRMFVANQQVSAYGESYYDSESRQLVYNELIRRADAILAQGRSLVLDGTFLCGKWRTEALKAAERHQALPVFFRCDCADEVADMRIARRTARGDSPSEAHAEILKRQADEEEPDPPCVRSIQIDTTEPLPALVDNAVAELKASYAR